MWLLFLWLLEKIAQSEASCKKKPQFGLDVSFVSTVSGQMWIECGFWFLWLL